ncbi:MAG: type II 3-dehydroquinate dehydratase [Puniceicoccales bacterium]|jgi:3-dehydroquinate dehydratase-2|nr:type II 3-dehydroquinate dehydratase [Puniceicoccales bacterium]
MIQKTFGILNGPNLDRLGVREPSVYGSATLSDVEDALRGTARELDVGVAFFQSNHEGELLDKIVAWADAGISGIVLNPGALAHTSVALRDCVAGCGLPVVEVHISNVYRREEFRHHSFTAAVCAGVVSGLGTEGYSLALRFLAGRARS